MRADIETLLQSGWNQVTSLSAGVSDSNVVKLTWLLEKLPIAEDLLLTYRSNQVNANTITKQIAELQAATPVDADAVAQAQANLRRAQKYMSQADGRMEILLYEYGKL